MRLSEAMFKTELLVRSSILLLYNIEYPGKRPDVLLRKLVGNWTSKTTSPSPGVRVLDVLNSKADSFRVWSDEPSTVRTYLVQMMYGETQALASS